MGGEAGDASKTSQNSWLTRHKMAYYRILKTQSVHSKWPITKAKQEHIILRGKTTLQESCKLWQIIFLACYHYHLTLVEYHEHKMPHFFVRGFQKRNELYVRDEKIFSENKYFGAWLLNGKAEA